MFECLSRKQSKLPILTPRVKQCPSSKKLDEKQVPQSRRKILVLSKKIPENSPFIQNIEASEQKKKTSINRDLISLSPVLNSSKPQTIGELHQINNSSNEPKITLSLQCSVQKSHDFKNKMGIRGVVSKDQIPTSLTSFGVVFQENSEDLKKEITQAVEDLTSGTVFLPKKNQSSLEGMRKNYSESQLEDVNQILQPIPEQSSSEIVQNLNEQFSKRLIERNFLQAEKFFKKMSKDEKNKEDAAGFTPIHLATLLSILQPQNALVMLKNLLKDLNINPCKKSTFNTKPIEEPILFKSIPTLTNLLRACYLYKISETRKSLKQIALTLEKLPDFTIQLHVKIDSFVPLIDKLLPDDTIKIYKKGHQLRVDYTLIGYSFLQSKRRNMSCIIQKQGQDIYTILSVNHDKKCYVDLLQPPTDEQFVLLIEDMLSTQVKRTSLILSNTSLKQQFNIFNQGIREFITCGLAVKNQLKVTYLSSTEKLMPRSKDVSKDLAFLNDWQSYLKYQPNKSTTKEKEKQLKLGVWLCQECPLKLDHLLEIMKFLSFAHESGSIIYNFLSDPKIKELFTGFPVKIEIPINFTLFLDIKVSELTLKSPGVKFSFAQEYERKKRCEEQKTLIRRQKRFTLLKFYT